MDELINRKIRRKVQEPQLAAMVDVFSLLIVFLVLGTVFNSASLALPEYVHLPISMSKQIIEVSHQVIITDQEVNFNFINKKVSMDIVREVSGDPKEIELKNAISIFVKQQPADAPLVLNVLADQQVSYKSIYDVIKYCRAVGFKTVSFITTGK